MAKNTDTREVHRPTGKFVKEGGYIGQTTVNNPKLPQGGSATAPINTTTNSNDSSNNKPQ